MPCNDPIKAVRFVLDDGSVNIHILKKFEYFPFDLTDPCCINLPCGKCRGCRMSHSIEWGMRCMHEASLYEKNCFVTLTFDDDHLKYSLDKCDFVKFMKRLRKKFGDGIRFFHCGEYGSKLGRPHHHALLFNFDFDDKYFSHKSKSGSKLYRSPSLEKLWPFGLSSIGTVTRKSAMYVARYALKKISKGGKRNFEQYDNFLEHYAKRVPEYITMSNRPGIGRFWLDKFKDDVYNHDYVVVDKGLKLRPPRYYDRVFALHEPDKFLKLKEERQKRIASFALSEENTPERMKVREELLCLRTNKLIRGYENGCC